MVSRLLATIALISLTGCSTMTTAEKWCVGASIADTAATYAALERGAREKNPALTVLGDDAATVVATSAAVTYGYIRLIRWLRDSKRLTSEQADVPLTVCATLRGTAAINNLKIAKEAD